MTNVIALPESKLVRNQEMQFGPRTIAGYGRDAWITAYIRFDDRCGNGHNSFTITAHVVTPASKRRGDIEAGGCMHEEIARIFPELAPFIKWHLTSTDGPLHYVANTTYWANQGNLEYARSSAVWPDATLGELQDVSLLEARLTQLMADFKADVEKLGFVY